MYCKVAMSVTMDGNEFCQVDVSVDRSALKAWAYCPNALPAK